MALEDAFDDFTGEDVQELAQAISDNEVAPDREQRLFELLAASTMEARQTVAEDHPAFIDVLAALGLDFRFPDELPREPPGDGELADRALDLLGRPDGFAVFLREFTDAGLRGLADEIATGQTTADQEDQLREQFEAVDDRTLRDGAEARRPLESVLAGLGVPVPAVEVEIEPEPIRAPPTPRRRPAPGRPSPYGANADKDIADRFFAGDWRKGNAWMAAEQERLSRFPDLSPRAYWREDGEQIWGGILTAGEFVEPGG